MPPSLPEFSIRPFARKGRLEDMIWRLYADAYTAMGLHFRKLGDKGKVAGGIFAGSTPERWRYGEFRGIAVTSEG